MKALVLFAPALLCACSAATDPGPAANDLGASRPDAALPGDGANIVTPASPTDSDSASPGEPGRASPSQAMPLPPAPVTDPCRALTAGDFSAWVNAMPGPGRRPTLIVTGKVTTPTGGWRLGLGHVRVAESYPVQVSVELSATPPAGAATQARVTHDLRREWPSEEKVGSVTVRCGARTLAQISPVETAH